MHVVLSRGSGGCGCLEAIEGMRVFRCLWVCLEKQLLRSGRGTSPLLATEETLSQHYLIMEVSPRPLLANKTTFSLLSSSATLRLDPLPPSNTLTLPINLSHSGKCIISGHTYMTLRNKKTLGFLFRVGSNVSASLPLTPQVGPHMEHCSHVWRTSSVPLWPLSTRSGLKIMPYHTPGCLSSSLPACNVSGISPALHVITPLTFEALMTCSRLCFTRLIPDTLLAAPPSLPDTLHTRVRETNFLSLSLSIYLRILRPSVKPSPPGHVFFHLTYKLQLSKRSATGGLVPCRIHRVRRSVCIWHQSAGVRLTSVRDVSTVLSHRENGFTY